MKGRSRIVGLLLLLLPATLYAAPTDCAVSSISSLNFGNYNPFSASPLDSAATVQIR
jgi:spore coat protein U-like protein